MTGGIRDYNFVTMSVRERRMAAGEFKAKCLAVLDEVAASKREVVITKRGRPVAKVVPLVGAGPVPRRNLIVRQGDLVSPIEEHWNVER